MEAYDLSEINEVTNAPGPAVSLFLNRSIDWNVDRPSVTRVIVDLTILSMGLTVNLIILVAILTQKRLHNPTSCYVLSLIVSNFVMLVNVMDDVMNHWFAADFEPDVDFIGRVTLQSSALTLVIISLDRYITICRVAKKWKITAAKLSTGIIAIFVIWSFAAITTAMELNLYLHLRLTTVINIFCWSTGLYLLFPTFVIVFLNTFIFLEIIESRGLARIRTCKDLSGLRLLVCLISNFYVTMVPQRIITIMYYKAPQICCSPLTMNVCYYLAKFSTISGPLIYIGNLKPFKHYVQKA